MLKVGQARYSRTHHLRLLERRPPVFFLLNTNTHTDTHTPAPVNEMKMTHTHTHTHKHTHKHTHFFPFFFIAAPVLEKKDSKYVRALFSYEAAADIELDLKEGDVVKVDF
jgi:hypothetical protein